MNKIIEDKGVKPGDKISIICKNSMFDGILMPTKSENSTFLKLKSGYNIGILNEKIIGVDMIEKEKKEKKEKPNIVQDSRLPKISILHTGGTIASKIDYKTGAVHSAFDPEDILSLFPKIRKLAQINSKLVFQMFSGDIDIQHWPILVKAIKEEIKINKPRGIIITHGTDTMAYTANALSYLITNSHIPIIIVGAQRSVDRGSSDGFMNLEAAINFINNTDMTGVAICMHENSSDESCVIHNGFYAKKIHTSRRDAFKSVNNEPIASIDEEGKITYYNSYSKYNSKEKTIYETNLSNDVAFIKFHPGFNSNIIDFWKNENIKGIVIEGTGLGHGPINNLDEITKHHPELLKKIEKYKENIVFVMTSQCIYGGINMNVYSYGRDLKKAGVISAKSMTSENAFVKLCYLLAKHNNNIKKVKEDFEKNLKGEFNESISFQA